MEQWGKTYYDFDILNAINNTPIPKKNSGGRVSAFWDPLPNGCPFLVGQWPTAVGYAEESRIQVENIDVAVDLYNNSIGRSYIYNNTTYGLFGIRKDFPSERRLLDEMRERTGSLHAFHWTWIATYPNMHDVNHSPATILGVVQADPTAAWETLYRHTASDWYYMALLVQGQPFN